jgi:hypothetical protein
MELYPHWPALIHSFRQVLPKHDLKIKAMEQHNNQERNLTHNHKPDEIASSQSKACLGIGKGF